MAPPYMIIKLHQSKIESLDCFTVFESHVIKAFGMLCGVIDSSKNRFEPICDLVLGGEDLTGKLEKFSCDPTL